MLTYTTFTAGERRRRMVVTIAAAAVFSFKYLIMVMKGLGYGCNSILAVNIGAKTV